MKIPYANLPLDHSELEAELLTAVRSVLTSGSFILGETVADFERQFAELHDLPYTVGVGSGFDALLLTLKAMGIGAGDEVVTVPNSFVATAAAIAVLGARPVLVDVDDYQTMDPDRLAEAISPRTKAIIPVHLTGRPAPMFEIMAVASARKIPVVEDCAQAVGATLAGRPVGTFGIAGCYSFHPLKNLGAVGDGGAIVTRDKVLADAIRLLRNHGLLDRDTCVRWGNNSRLDALQAAILKTKLGSLARLTERRRQIASQYLARFERLPFSFIPRERPDEYCVWHAFVVQAPLRDELQSFLRQRGIEALIHYPVPIHLQPVANEMGYPRGSFSVCEQQAASILSLPIRASLRNEEVAWIMDSVCSFFNH